MLTPDERADRIVSQLWTSGYEYGDMVRAISTAIQSATDELRTTNIRLVKENTELARLNANAIDLLTELWETYAYPGKDGQLWPGGLSLLENLDRFLHPK